MLKLKKQLSTIYNYTFSIHWYRCETNDTNYIIMLQNKSFYLSQHRFSSGVAVTDLKGRVEKHVPALTKIAPFSNKNEKYRALKLLFQDTWLFKTCFSGRVWQWEGMIGGRGKNTRKTGGEKDAEIRARGRGWSGEGHTILS